MTNDSNDGDGDGSNEKIDTNEISAAVMVVKPRRSFMMKVTDMMNSRSSMMASRASIFEVENEDEDDHEEMNEDDEAAFIEAMYGGDNPTTGTDAGGGGHCRRGSDFTIESSKLGSKGSAPRRRSSLMAMQRPSIIIMNAFGHRAENAETQKQKKDLQQQLEKLDDKLEYTKCRLEAFRIMNEEPQLRRRNSLELLEGDSERLHFQIKREMEKMFQRDKANESDSATMSLHKYITAIRRASPATSTYLARLEAEACQALHKMGVLDHQEQRNQELSEQLQDWLKTDVIEQLREEKRVMVESLQMQLDELDAARKATVEAYEATLFYQRKKLDRLKLQFDPTRQDPSTGQRVRSSSRRRSMGDDVDVERGQSRGPSTYRDDRRGSYSYSQGLLQQSRISLVISATEGESRKSGARRRFSGHSGSSSSTAADCSSDRSENDIKDFPPVEEINGWKTRRRSSCSISGIASLESFLEEISDDDSDN